MTAYFTASIAGKQYHTAKYQKIIDILRAKNIEVMADHIMDATEAKISLETKQERIAFHNKLEEWITGCDFMVAEVTFPSISVGYEISLAIHRGKPVLLLYSEGNPPSLLSEHKEERIICEKYTITTLREIIDYFLYYVKGSNDMRFTFFITPKIAAYLEDLSKKAKIPKSVYLRHLIEMDMKENKYPLR